MQENRFKEALLNPSVFPVTWELVPGRGAREDAQDKALALAGQAVSNSQIFALTLTDNPGGTPAMSADFMGSELSVWASNPSSILPAKTRTVMP